MSQTPDFANIQIRGISRVHEVYSKNVHIMKTYVQCLFYIYGYTVINLNRISSIFGNYSATL